MPPAVLAQLILTFGPMAMEWIVKLAELWSKPELTPEEVQTICLAARKSYDDYIAEAQAELPMTTTTVLPPTT